MSGIIGGIGLPKSGVLQSVSGEDFAVNIGKLRIQVVSGTSAGESDAGSAYEPRYYSLCTIAITGFASAPATSLQFITTFHDMAEGTTYSASTTAVTMYANCPRSGSVGGRAFKIICIGEAS